MVSTAIAIPIFEANNYGRGILVCFLMNTRMTEKQNKKVNKKMTMAMNVVF